jgi:hypothetical protein
MTRPTFIRVAEVWRATPDGSLLELIGGHYGAAKNLAAASVDLFFGRGEGLPGVAWDEGRPIVLKAFEGTAFRRTKAAHADGLTSGIALPIFAGDTIKAVVLIFCGDGAASAQGEPEQEQAGAIELWRNQPDHSPDMVLDDGYYGRISNVFEFISRRTAFRKGTGLPGLVWESGLPVFMPDLGKGGRFLRAESAQKVGINRGFAIPCATRGDDVYVMAFLSALATPLVRRFENWLPIDGGTALLRREGFCEDAGALDQGRSAERVAAGSGAIGSAYSTGVPALGPAAGALGPLVALPILDRRGAVVAVVAWYF